MVVAPDGRPSVILSSDAGKPVLQLSAGPGESAELSLVSGESRGSLRVEEGKLRWSLSRGESTSVQATLEPDSPARIELMGGRPDSKLTLSADKEGALSVQMAAGPSATAQIQASAAGDAQIGVGSATGKLDAFLRIDAAGNGEIALRGREQPGGPIMTLLPSGDMGIAAKGPDGATGPMMQLLKSGLGEVSVTGPDAKSGPSLMRLPDGVATIFVRGMGGDHGPSMILLPDGTAQTGVVAKSSKSQAALRVNPDGSAFLRITDPAGATSAVFPQPPPPAEGAPGGETPPAQNPAPPPTP